MRSCFVKPDWRCFVLKWVFPLIMRSISEIDETFHEVLLLARMFIERQAPCFNLVTKTVFGQVAWARAGILGDRVTAICRNKDTEKFCDDEAKKRTPPPPPPAPPNRDVTGLFLPNLDSRAVFKVWCSWKNATAFRHSYKLCNLNWTFVLVFLETLLHQTSWSVKLSELHSNRIEEALSKMVTTTCNHDVFVVGDIGCMPLGHVSLHLGRKQSRKWKQPLAWQLLFIKI